MTDAAHDPRAATLALVNSLIRRGLALLRTSQSAGPEPVDGRARPLVVRQAHHERDGVDPAQAEVRIWQNDCAAAVNELSGGSKAHWLSRAYSGALMVRSTDGEAMVEADIAEIVFRVLDVLEQARRSIASLAPGTPAPSGAPVPHRFDFVHDGQLRPVLEQAFADGTRAFEAGDYDRALMTSCGIIEAILTDALKVRLKADPTTDTAQLAVRGVRLPASARPLASFGEATPERAQGSPAREGGQPNLNALSFDERIAAAENEGLIRGGCARLPAVARAYRSDDSHAPISEHDAKVTRQVLRVVMRDLDPGR